jgi:hypothetical protein
LPTPVLRNNSPIHTLFHREPDYSFLRTFGCACWPNLHPYNKNKLQPRSLLCLFLGYSPLHKRYKCIHLPSNRVYISRDVVFNENSFPYTSASPTSSLSPNIYVRYSTIQIHYSFLMTISPRQHLLWTFHRQQKISSYGLLTQHHHPITHYPFQIP